MGDLASTNLASYLDLDSDFGKVILSVNSLDISDNLPLKYCQPQNIPSDPVLANITTLKDETNIS